MKLKKQIVQEVAGQDQVIRDITSRRAIHNSGYNRKDRDFYATPTWVTEALLRHIKFRGPIWEPCCGTGAMSTVLTKHGHEVVSTDIVDRGFGTAGIDFMNCKAVPSGCRTISATLSLFRKPPMVSLLFWCGYNGLPESGLLI
ncbi:hypothetical protein [Acidiphilium sp. 37-64-53]|uniref:hypothetical protein n=1 Tax=Acidiphilium sp. 37-64-53 TaxID=1970299 RepID=UPI00257A604C|nr:hypothetical protein [Acidiphilium sp. 37-64-53]